MEIKNGVLTTGLPQRGKTEVGDNVVNNVYLHLASRNGWDGGSGEFRYERRAQITKVSYKDKLYRFGADESVGSKRATGYPHQDEKVRTEPSWGLLGYGIPELTKLRPGIHTASLLRPCTTGPRA